MYKSYDDLNHKDKENISDYYWESLEPYTDGLGDPFPLEHIRFEYGVSLGWGALIQIFRDCGHAL